MSILNAAFLYDLESNMQVITENTYTSLVQNQWWRKVAKEMSSKSKKERVAWLLETGFLQYGVEGQVQFVDLATQMQALENKYVNGSGLKMLRSQLEDLDGGGVDAANAWSRTMGALAANFPQQELAKLILSNPVCYDGLTFFHANAAGTSGHPYDPTNGSPGSARFANHFTGAAGANNPGALPISGVTIDVAQANINKGLAYIASIPQPNGINPRKLKAKKLFVPPALRYPALLATRSNMIAMAAASGGGGADVTSSPTGELEVVVVDEFATALGGSDTDYYFGCEDFSGQLGAFVFVNREAFNISYHGPMTDAQLASKREFEWLPHGRSVVGPGHPYLFFKASAT
jgi:hypothetical protein